MCILSCCWITVFPHLSLRAFCVGSSGFFSASMRRAGDTRRSRYLSRRRHFSTSRVGGIASDRAKNLILRHAHPAGRRRCSFSLSSSPYAMIASSTYSSSARRKFPHRRRTLMELQRRPSDGRAFTSRGLAASMSLCLNFGMQAAVQATTVALTGACYSFYFVHHPS